MDRKCYTIILVPHTRARFRKVQVSTVQLWGSVAVVLALAATASVLGWLYLTAPVDERQIARLNGENDELRSVNQSFEVSLRQLQAQLAEYEERTRKLAIVAGIEEVDNGGDAGLGGATGTLGGGLDAIERRSAALEATLDGVERRLEERVRWISSTPSVTPNSTT